jgi:hypothetical protein
VPIGLGGIGIGIGMGIGGLGGVVGIGSVGLAGGSLQVAPSQVPPLLPQALPSLAGSATQPVLASLQCSQGPHELSLHVPWHWPPAHI